MSGDDGGRARHTEDTSYVHVPKWVIPALLTLILAVCGGILNEMITLNDQHSQIRERIAVVETRETAVQSNVDRILLLVERNSSVFDRGK